MADRRKAGLNPADNNQETDRQFMDKNNVNGMLKDVLIKLIANRPDDPIGFIANYFETLTLDNQSNDLINRASQVLNLTYHSRPVFETNVHTAFDILDRYRISKKLSGVNGTIYTQLLQVVCKNIPLAVTINLFKRLACSEHEAVTYDVFRSSIFTCCVLNDFVAVATNLFNTLDIQKTGKADKNLCESTLEQLKSALASSQADVKKIMESSYNLGPDGLYIALEKAMSRKEVDEGFYTQEEFVIEACETFLTKVKHLK